MVKFFIYDGTLFASMSGIALIGAALIIMILNILPSTLPIQLSGQVHLLYVLTTLFCGVVTYKSLDD